MKEFIEKLIGRLEEEKNKRLLFEDNATEEEAGWYFSGSRNGLADAIAIVNQLAGEYINCSTDTSTDCSTDDGWIPCEKELPEDDRDVLVVMSDGSMMVDFRTASSSGWFWSDNDYMPLAWRELPQPYQPKGE